MKLALIQFNTLWEDKGRNLARAEALFDKASRAKCDVIVFPEMFSTGFTMNALAVAESVKGETGSFLSHSAKKYSINVVAGFPALTKGIKKPVNLAVVFNKRGTLIARYAKMHPFTYAKEGTYYAAGKKPVVFSVNGVPSSVFICYDLRFPEVFRRVARKVPLIFVIANWPASRQEHWTTLLRARAIENQCFVIGVNRIGKDGNGITYKGASRIFGPLGEEICSGKKDRELVLCHIDPAEVEKARKQFPFLRDMRF